jgi:hypothetical protein
MIHLVLVLRVAFGLFVCLVSLFTFSLGLWALAYQDATFLGSSIALLASSLIGAALLWVGWKLIVPPLRGKTAA